MTLVEANLFLSWESTVESIDVGGAWQVVQKRGFDLSP